MEKSKFPSFLKEGWPGTANICLIINYSRAGVVGFFVSKSEYNYYKNTLLMIDNA
jgi:uncharacterized protein (DUF779 family)